MKLQKNETKNRLSNIKDPLTERFEVQILVLHQSMCMCKADSSSLRHVWDSHSNIGTSCNSKLKLPKFKDVNMYQNYRRNTQRWMNDCNTPIIKLWNFSWEFQFKLWDFNSCFKYFYCWRGRVFPRR